MKGKYASRAASTQARLDAQTRARLAEQQVRVLEKQMAAMQAKHESVTTRLATEVAELNASLVLVTAQRDAQVAPALDEARIFASRAEGERDRLRLVVAGIPDALVGLGMSRREAIRVAKALIDREHPTDVVDYAVSASSERSLVLRLKMAADSAR